MKLRFINNKTTINFVENSSELIRLPKYKNIKQVEEEIGLAFHLSNFYGLWREDDELVALKDYQTEFNFEGTIRIYVEGVVKLSKEPINNLGKVTYHGYGRLEIEGIKVLYDGRTGFSGGSQGGNSGGTPGGDYVLEAPSNGKTYGRKDERWVEIEGFDQQAFEDLYLAEDWSEDDKLATIGLIKENTSENLNRDIDGGSSSSIYLSSQSLDGGNANL